MDARSEFAAAANIAEPGTSELIERFANRDPESQSLRDSWGYVEMGSDTDTGFARWAFADYRPQTDLLELAKEIALVIEHDCYIVDHIELATELPSVWLGSATDKSHIALLAIASGGATISSRLEEGKHSAPRSQMFTMFVVELDSPDSARHLLQMSKAKRTETYLPCASRGRGLLPG